MRLARRFRSRPREQSHLDPCSSKMACGDHVRANALLVCSATRSLSACWSNPSAAMSSIFREALGELPT